MQAHVAEGTKLPDLNCLHKVCPKVTNSSIHSFQYNQSGDLTTFNEVNCLLLGLCCSLKEYKKTPHVLILKMGNSSVCV